MVRRAGANAIRVLAVVIAVASLSVSSARGDGDPASDALIAQNVFYPYSTSVPSAARRALNAAVANLTRATAPVKVALIAHPDDLGSITELYGRPQRYANFLHTEISYGTTVRLIVVMASGDGTAGLPESLARAIRRLPPAGSASGAALVRAATRAVDVVARATNPSAASAAPGARSGSGSGRTVLLLSLILAAFLVFGAVVLLRIFFPPTSAVVSVGTHSGSAVERTRRPRGRFRRRG